MNRRGALGRARTVVVFSLILLACVAAPVLADSSGQGGKIGVSEAQVVAAAPRSGPEAGGSETEGGGEAEAPVAPKGPTAVEPVVEPAPAEETPPGLLREPELETPEAIAEREDSQLAYAGLAPEEAKFLLGASFAPQLQAIEADPARALAKAKLDQVTSATEALVSVEGEKAWSNRACRCARPTPKASSPRSTSACARAAMATRR